MANSCDGRIICILVRLDGTTAFASTKLRRGVRALWWHGQDAKKGDAAEWHELRKQLSCKARRRGNRSGPEQRLKTGLQLDTNAGASGIINDRTETLLASRASHVSVDARRIYFRRTSGRPRHHCDPDRTPAPGHPPRARGRRIHAVSEQS